MIDPTNECGALAAPAVPWTQMTEAQKKVREYLAEIGKRGGLASRRELTKSHARQMVAIREAKRA